MPLMYGLLHILRSDPSLTNISRCTIFEFFLEDSMVINALESRSKHCFEEVF
jgi:hypothetical protein